MMLTNTAALVVAIVMLRASSAAAPPPMTDPFQLVLTWRAIHQVESIRNGHDLPR